MQMSRTEGADCEFRKRNSIVEIAEYSKMKSLFMSGKLEQLSELLDPHVKNGDLDAIFLRAHFDLDPDPNLSADEEDSKLAEVIQTLARKGHAKSQLALAWMYRHGDGVEQSYENFLLLLGVAAMEGDNNAKEDLSREFEIVFGQ